MDYKKIRLLIADDEKNIRNVLHTELSADGHLVALAESGQQALDLLHQDEFDVLILDLNMPGVGGIEVLERIKALDLPTEVIVLTANATIPTAVKAMKLGAYEYLTKPFDLENLLNIIDRASEKKMLRSDNLRLRTHMKREFTAPDVIAHSPAMRAVLETVRIVAPTDYTVMITGESGVGKELIARTLHNQSVWRDGPFVAINCGAIPDNMIESELFGYEKGAFTGAYARKLGLMEIADNGTLFLDEIGDMPLPLQVKLLRVLETGSFFRLGGSREQHVRIRVVSATNKDLKSEIARGLFRQDLFFRISGFTIHVPPLRLRAEDIPFFIDYCARKSSSFRQKRFDKESIEILSRYRWPGNVRELQHVVQRVLLLSKEDVIKPSDLPADVCADQGAPGRRLDDIERDYIMKVLKETEGRKEKAADILGIHLKTLRRKLDEYRAVD